MKFKSLIIFIAFAIFLLPENVFAISARSAVVIDAASGRVLYSHNSDAKMGMASTTKIMTALCAIEQGNLADIVTVSPTASGVEGSSMYLATGEKISLSDLLYGLMLVSGNDAATAIAQHISGSTESFAALMNKKAMEIGAYNSSFTNPHGLSDDNHYTTAKDLAIITARALKNPLFREIVSTKSKALPQTQGGIARHLTNHNKFLNMYEGCIGVKTGFTKKTGRCLVTAAEKNGMTLICVTLNDPDDWADHKVLLDNAFGTYKSEIIHAKGTHIATAQIEGGTSPTVDLVTGEDICIPLADGEENRVEIKTEVYEDLCAPIKSGDILGALKVMIDGKSCGEFSLVTNCSIEEKAPIFTPQNGTFGESFKSLLYAWLTCFK